MSLFNPLDAKLDLEAGATEESVGLIKKGYQDYGDFEIQCIGCNKNCVRMTIVDKNDKYPDQTVQVSCQKCKQLSFKKHVGRVKMYSDAIHPYKISDIQLIQNNLMIEVI